MRLALATSVLALGEVTEERSRESPAPERQDGSPNQIYSQRCEESFPECTLL